MQKDSVPSPSQGVGVRFNISEKQDTIEVVADPENKGTSNNTPSLALGAD
jgi:hypothetical protein